MTLLVLEIKVPELSSEQVEAGELAHALCEQLPHVFAYALSFLVIAATWLTHHNVWKFVRRITAGAMWLNILRLMLVAYMPVPTALIASYGPSSPIAPIAMRFRQRRSAYCTWRSGRTPDDTTCWIRWWNRTCS